MKMDSVQITGTIVFGMVLVFILSLVGMSLLYEASQDKKILQTTTCAQAVYISGGLRPPYVPRNLCKDSE